VLGSVAQMIALTIYGNAALHENSINVSALYPSNSTFQYCEYVRFVDVTTSAKQVEEVQWATDSLAWFGRLRNDGFYALRLHYGATGGKTLDGYHVPDRMLAGLVGGGGRWLIEAISPHGADYWEGSWEVGNRARADRRIWRVTYARIAHGQPTQAAEPQDLEALKRELSTVLTDIHGYARSHGLNTFASLFECSQAQLASTSPGSGVYHSDLAPATRLPLLAQQLLAAAQLSWVFGGMGSWNDVTHGGADDKEYQRLSEALFRLLNQTYVAVANSTAPAVVER
jgi:hypothetical protein